MSIQDTLGALANNLRSASGYQDKLSLSEMGSIATGLTTYNLLPNTSSEVKEVQVNDNDWSSLLFTNITIPAGIYTYSIYLDLTDYSTQVTDRIEWNYKLGSYPLDSSKDVNANWGTYSNWIKAGDRALVSTSFKLMSTDTIKLGLSGSPFKTGTIKYSKPMLNVGTFTLPYTSNTLVRGGENRLSFIMLSFLSLFERVVI